MLAAIGMVGARLHHGPQGVTLGLVIEIAILALGGSMPMLAVGGVLYVITALWPH